MGTARIAAALARAREVFTRRPTLAMHTDSAACARWEGGLRISTLHPSGKSVVSDMPVELGGTGDQITPGWFSRAGTAACTATCISMLAASRGIELTALEVTVTSRSDARGVLAMAADGDTPIDAAPSGFTVRVLIRAGNASSEDLERLVADGYRHSPSALCLVRANEVALQIEAST